MPAPKVAVGSLGGTIAMTPGASAPSPGRTAGAVVPTLRAADLLAAVPALAEIATVTADDVRTVPGASLTEADLREALLWARAQVDAGAVGVVLTQGTDTLEETAYLLDLWWDRAAPLVLTGAMRSAAVPGADGPANLLAAVRTASAPAARDCGALVVMDDRVHAASRVRKSHATTTGAFTSPDTGPLGSVHEGRVLVRPSRRHPSLPLPVRTARVALLETHLGDDGALLRASAELDHDAVVLAAYGVGHVSADLAEVVSEVQARIPVVVASRTGAGSTARATYGFPGSETDLVRRGALLAGWLDPRKARVLTWAVLSSTSSPDRLASELATRGEEPM
ncbi:asparaginase [Aeromicrobium sp. CF4.19]|uniref:asparaginase n=1 Tax=Aeromicrobium sp. CF4.19 TaxID=3373082 RepID=UPI003EE5B0A3